VPSAADARAVLARPTHGIVAVVSDVMMPGETGIDFAAWLRTDHAAVPIMLISGHTGTALDLESRGSSHLPLLRKPFGRAELDERLRELLGT
ncbi:MAG: response regulator, partial [Gemmatimonadaceae bacterium]|nr:response regulator [Gemmatimonadaceae bacterium]